MDYRFFLLIVQIFYLKCKCSKDIQLEELIEKDLLKHYLGIKLSNNFFSFFIIDFHNYNMNDVN